MKSARNTTAKTEIEELIEKSNVALSHSEIQKSLEFAIGLPFFVSWIG
jgi:hypothetical protein